MQNYTHSYYRLELTHTIAEEHLLEKLFANIRFEKSQVYLSPCHQHQNQYKDTPGKQALQTSVTININRRQ